MLLTHDPATTAARLASGILVCPSGHCGGQLGPWGHARPRAVRLGASWGEAHTPRRARCRRCRRTQVLLPTRSYPRRADAVETVGVALLGAADSVYPGTETMLRYVVKDARASQRLLRWGREGPGQHDVRHLGREHSQPADLRIVNGELHMRAQPGR